jgi:hypothetical protein
LIYTLVVGLHLLATCAAIGTIVLTDMRLLAKVMGYKVVIPAPETLETRVISIALLALYATGAFIVWTGLEKNPQYLLNEKLQAKLLLVALLTLNAFYLHFKIFPLLKNAREVSRWTRAHWISTAVSVSLSNSIWLFCAFLGIARIWNHTVSIGYVLCVASIFWAMLFVAVNAVLFLASRDAPKPVPDWVDEFKSRVTDFAELK